MDRKTIFAFVLIGIILILTQTTFYKSKVLPERPIDSQPSHFSEDTLKNSEPIENQRITDLSEEKTVVLDSEKQKNQREDIVQPQPSLFSEIEQSSEPEQKINIRTPLYHAIISSKGGGVVSWKLQQYADADSQFVELVPNIKYGLPTIGMVIDRDTVLFRQNIYNQQRITQSFTNDINLNTENQSFSISYLLEFQDGKKIVKNYTFYSDRYDFDFNVDLEGFSNLISDKSYHLNWDASLLPTETPIQNDNGFLKVYANLSDDIQDFNISEKDNQWKSEEVTGTVNWTAIRTKYFMSAIVPMDNKGRSIYYRGIGIPFSPNQRFKYYDYSIIMPFNDTEKQQNQYKLYLGPVEYNGLKDLGVGLDKLVMSSGGYERLFRPFSIIILVSLKFLHKFISNYGIVIILFSILIKIILYPLTHKSYVSMKKMQLVQPMMTELREKYKNEPQQLNKQMMKLYKDYGVNPMGGCLPMLLQMPLLIGLFIVFRSTIELRGAEFFWWISDLSKPDVIFHLPFTIPLYGNIVGLLPIVMGLTMFLQQKSTMQDPRQKMMAYFMPIFFILLFNSFPSGLNLYYTLFNVWTILQQKFVKTDKLELKPVEKKKERKKHYKK